MGKGDTRRPSDVTPQQYADNWRRTFRGSTPMPMIQRDPAHAAERAAQDAHDPAREETAGRGDA